MPGLDTKHYTGNAALDTIPELLAEMIVKGEKVQYNEGTKSGVVTSYNFKGTDYLPGTNTQAHVTVWSNMSQAKDLVFFMAGGAGKEDIPVKSNKIFKTVEFGGGGGGKQGFNMGNVSEGIFAAAIFAKFWIGREIN